MKIWNSTSFELITTVNTDSFLITILPNSSNIVSANYDNTIKICQIYKIQPNKTGIFNSIYTSNHETSGITAIAFFNYIYLVVGFSDSQIKYWNIININLLAISLFKSQNQAITCLFNLNNQYLLSGSLDRKITVYDLNFNKYDELTVHKGRIN